MMFKGSSLNINSLSIRLMDLAELLTYWRASGGEGFEL